MLRVWMAAGFATALAVGGLTPALAQDELAKAQEIVDAYSKPNPPWDGPTTGPAGQEGKLVVYVSTDQRNGGARGVGEGVVEAAEVLGWDHRTIDGQGTVSGRSSGLTQAIALQPAAIVLGGIDANEQAALIEEADKAGIKVVGWHAYAYPGPHKTLPVFTNITTDPLKVAEAAAAYAVTTSGGTAGAIVFTDSVYEIAVAKADAMAEVIKACSGCTLLEYNPFAKKLNIVSLGRLQLAIDAGKLSADGTVTVAEMVSAGILRRAKDGVRVLSDGELKAPLKLSVWGASKAAVEAVEKAGGSIEILAPQKSETAEG